MHFDKELDARGLACPLPIVKTRKALNELASGQVLKVVATDSGSVADMKAFSEQTGNELLSSAQEGGTYETTLQVLSNDEDEPVYEVVLVGESPRYARTEITHSAIDENGTRRVLKTKAQDPVDEIKRHPPEYR